MSPPPAETESAAYAEVDAALRSDPLAPAPRALRAKVMAAVAAWPRATARPGFRLGWIDLALSLFLSGMLALLLLLAQWAATPAGRLLLARVYLVVQLTHVSAWAGLLLGGVALAVVALATAVLLFVAFRRSA
jgi:hypothetical protein